MSAPIPPYTKRIRQSGEALPSTIDKMHSDVYVPARDNPPPPMRPNAMDFLKKPSKGFPT